MIFFLGLILFCYCMNKLAITKEMVSGMWEDFKQYGGGDDA